MSTPPSLREPLLNKTIFVACSAKKAKELVAGLRSMGGKVLALHVIAVQEIDDKRLLDESLTLLQEYMWIVFTSSYGVTFFVQRLNDCRISRDLGKHTKICAVGPATARTLKESGFEVALIPEEFSAEGVLQALEKYHGSLRYLKGHRILLPRAREARDVLPRALIAAGARVDVVPCYQTVAAALDEELIRRIRTEVPDLLVFTSSSTVKNLMRILGNEDGIRMLQNVTVAVLGPITAGTAKSFGKRVEIIPRENTVASLLEAIRNYYSRQSTVGSRQ
jgi:uroporphyrinogen III methyltransferase/synthase